VICFLLLWHLGTHTDAIHVMIWVGDNMLIEASPISMTVREASIEEVFYGHSLNDIKNGQEFFANEKMRSVQFSPLFIILRFLR
jgi:hypothetical protein